MFGTYPKIKNLYKRDTTTGRVLIGEFSDPIFEYLQNNLWYIYEKIDGMNVRVIWDPATQTIAFRGKTDAAQMPAQLLENLAKRFTLEKMADVFPNTAVCLYGEGYGPKIQGGSYYRDDQDFILFDIRFPNSWALREVVTQLAEILDTPCVPLVGIGPLTSFPLRFRELSTFPSPCTGQPYKYEGFIARPNVPIFDQSGFPITVKIKQRDFPSLAA